MDRLKNSPLFKIVYWIPGLLPLYHFTLAWLGSFVYSYPSKKIFVVGVTGTKGKTTTLELINAILEAAGKKTALLSSLRVKVAGESEKNKTENSMPGRFFIQKFLKQAINEDCTYALIEVTSQGVAYSRHRFINWDAAILTNLAPEHIEAHGTFEKYRAAKLAFLRYVAARGGKIFLNRDDKYFDFFDKALLSFKPSNYSQNGEARLFSGIAPAATAAEPRFILSEFNKSNVAAAVSLVRDIGIDEKTIEEALRNFPGVPGRLEFVQRQPFAVVVDYAHTVESLESVYRALKSMVNGQLSNVAAPRLICVLGAAGGGRDEWKRPAMGKVAAEYCDKIILTNEDPYDEDPHEIIEQIASGFARVPGASFREVNFEKILDRREAIKKALSLAREGDTVVLTGKGSEEYIHAQNGEKIPWSERRAVEEVLYRNKTKQ